MTIEQLEQRMESATESFCKTRVPTGETGQYPVVPVTKDCSISDAEDEMESATQTFLKSKSGETSAA